MTNDLLLDPGSAPLPGDVDGYWLWAIAAVTPLIVQLVRQLVPKIPKWVLPSVTPFLGLALGMLANAVADLNLVWWSSAAFGGFGVAIREIVDQAVKARHSAVEAPKP